jgi:hypothetical protein
MTVRFLQACARCYVYLTFADAISLTGLFSVAVLLVKRRTKNAP